MINTIYIPTYGRQGNQVTFDNLPDKWKEKTFLITHPDQDHSGYPEIKCDAQGKGIAEVRKWICQYGEGKRYGMLDDDIEFLYTKRDGEEGPGNSKLSDEKFDDMIHDALINLRENWEYEMYDRDHHIDMAIANDWCFDEDGSFVYPDSNRYSHLVYQDG